MTQIDKDRRRAAKGAEAKALARFVGDDEDWEIGDDDDEIEAAEAEAREEQHRQRRTAAVAKALAGE